MTLPSTCTQCKMHRPTGECIRHAPGVTTAKNERAKWPTTREDQRCGSGSTTDEPVRCSQCLHWDTRIAIAPPKRAADNPFFPVRSKYGDEWWANVHPCTRYAPSPGASTFGAEWRVTHGDEDACGDGVGI
jgi:hypothetical protein